MPVRPLNVGNYSLDFPFCSSQWSSGSPSLCILRLFSLSPSIPPSSRGLFISLHARHDPRLTTHLQQPNGVMFKSRTLRRCQSPWTQLDSHQIAAMVMRVSVWQNCKLKAMDRHPSASLMAALSPKSSSWPLLQSRVPIRDKSIQIISTYFHVKKRKLVLEPTEALFWGIIRICTHDEN